MYDAHLPFVWQALRRLGVSDADAADHAQAVFQVAHTRLKTFEGRSTLDTWLFGICRRVAWNHRRTRLRRPEIPVDPSTFDACPDRKWDPAEAHDSRARVEAALRGLSPRQVQVFVLSELEELRVPEIAKLLGVSGSVVKYRLRSARQRLLRTVSRWRVSRHCRD